MKVILLNNIRGVGQIGDIKDVSDGYGRNFLIPRKMAKLATDSSVKESEQLRKKMELQKSIQAQSAIGYVKELEEIVLTFTKKASENGTLFASLTAQEIAQALSLKLGGKISEEMIDLSDHGGHVKHVGEHNLKINLTPEISGTVRVIVNPE